MTNEDQAIENIGVAICEADGTIKLMLRAEGPEGIVGESMAVYASDHKDYASIAAHLGGIQPGEDKLIPPFN